MDCMRKLLWKDAWPIRLLPMVWEKGEVEMTEYYTRVTLSEYEITLKTDNSDNYHAVQQLCRKFVNEEVEKSYFCPDCFYHIRNREFEYCPICGKEVKWN